MQLFARFLNLVVAQAYYDAERTLVIDPYTKRYHRAAIQYGTPMERKRTRLLQLCELAMERYLPWHLDNRM